MRMAMLSSSTRLAMLPTCMLADRPLFFFQAEDGMRHLTVTGVQTCALPIFEIERARRVGKFARAAEALLFGEQRVQQGPRGERRLDRGDGVDEIGLRDHADRRAAVERKIGRASCRERV